MPSKCWARKRLFDQMNNHNQRMVNTEVARGARRSTDRREADRIMRWAPEYKVVSLDAYDLEGTRVPESDGSPLDRLLAWEAVEERLRAEGPSWSI